MLFDCQVLNVQNVHNLKEFELSLETFNLVQDGRVVIKSRGPGIFPGY